jgi:hypothetical protein
VLQRTGGDVTRFNRTPRPARPLNTALGLMSHTVLPLPGLEALCAPRCKLDASSLRSQWNWLLAPGDTPLAVTALGDLFVTRPTGAVALLDAASATCVEVASSQAEFHASVSHPDNIRECFLPELVNALTFTHGPLQPGQCFSCVVPLTLGGTMSPENFAPLSVEPHFRALSFLQRQALSLPIGASIAAVHLEGET